MEKKIENKVDNREKCEEAGIKKIRFRKIYDSFLIYILPLFLSTVAMLEYSSAKIVIEQKNELVGLVYYFCFYFVMRTYVEYKDKYYEILKEGKNKLSKKRFNVVTIIATLFIAFGLNIGFYRHFFEMVTFKEMRILYYMYLILKTIMFTSLSFVVIRLIFMISDIKMDADKNKVEKDKKFEDNKKINERNKKLKKLLIIDGIIFFVLWFGYFLVFKPGVITHDTNNQLYQILIDHKITSNHHPAFHTFVLKIMMEFGRLISGGNNNFAFAFTTLLHMLIASYVFSYVIYQMRKHNCKEFIIRATYIIIALFPGIPMMSLLPYKDTLFNLTLVLLIIKLIDYINLENPVNNKKESIKIMILLLLAMLFRNNGMHIYLVVLPFILVYFIVRYKKYYKEHNKNFGLSVVGLNIVFVLPLIAYLIILGPVYDKFGIVKSNPAEAFSLPMQFMAKVANTKELDEDTIKRIDKYLDYEEIKEKYYEDISDPVKSTFKLDNYKEDKEGFFKLYFDLLKRYSDAQFKSFIASTDHYYNPMYTKIAPTYITMENEYGIRETDHAKLGYSIFKQGGIMATTANIGLTYYAIFIAFMYAIYKRRYRELLIFGIAIGDFATVLLSPVNGEHRYILLFIYSWFLYYAIALGYFIDSDKIETSLRNKKQ